MTAYFLHRYFDKGENIYVETPRGFKQKVNNGKNTVLKLKNIIYGLRHRHRNLWNHLTAKLEAYG